MYQESYKVHRSSITKIKKNLSASQQRNRLLLNPNRPIQRKRIVQLRHNKVQPLKETQKHMVETYITLTPPHSFRPSLSLLSRFKKL